MKKNSKNKKKKNNNTNNKFNFDNDYFIGVSGMNEPSKQRNNSINNNNSNNKKSKKNIKLKKKTGINSHPVNKIKSKKLLEQEKKKRKKQNIAKILVLIFIIIGVTSFLFISSTFDIEHIEVKENKKVSSERINSISGIKMYNNIFLFAKQNVVEEIKKSEPYIEDVIITRQLPDKVILEIKERVPVMQVELEDKTYAYINEDGYILEYSIDKLDMPIITNARTDFSNLRAKNETARLTEKDVECLKLSLKVISLMKEYELASYIVGFDISNTHDLQLKLNQKNKIVHLGDCSELKTRILYLKRILEDTKDEKGEIFINGNLNEDYVYFREDV